MRARIVRWSVLMLGAAVLAACAPASQVAQEVGQLPDLGGVEALKQQFNADAGTPRLILFLSPT